MSNLNYISNVKTGTVSLHGMNITVPDYNYYLDLDDETLRKEYRKMTLIDKTEIYKLNDWTKNGMRGLVVITIKVGDFSYNIFGGDISDKNYGLKLTGFEKFYRFLTGVDNFIKMLKSQGLNWIWLNTYIDFDVSKFQRVINNKLIDNLQDKEFTSPDVDLKIEPNGKEGSVILRMYIKTMDAFNKSKYPQFWSVDEYDNVEVFGFFESEDNFRMLNENNYYIDGESDSGLPIFDEDNSEWAYFVVSERVEKQLSAKASPIVDEVIKELTQSQDTIQKLTNNYGLLYTNLYNTINKTTDDLTLNENSIIKGLLTRRYTQLLKNSIGELYRVDIDNKNVSHMSEVRVRSKND